MNDADLLALYFARDERASNETYRKFGGYCYTIANNILGSDPDEVNLNLENELERRLVLRAVERLNPRECQIMELRFGLHGKKEHTQKQVADILGISQSYISRLEKKIIAGLKAELEKVM